MSNVQNWIDKIDNYVADEKVATRKAEEAKERERFELEEKVRSYAVRVSDMLDIINHIRLKTSLKFRGDADKGYESGYFETDSYYHRLGFVNPNIYDKTQPFTKIGIYAGGAWGCWNFIYEITNNNLVLIYQQHESSRKTAPASTEQLKRFLEKFDEFEQSFYNYLEKITNKEDK